MLRAMLAGRFQLKVHIEQREQPVFDLVLARKDGKLGPGLTSSDANCDTPPAPSTERADLSAPPPPCTVRMVGAMLRADKQGPLGDLMEGNTSMDRLADALRISAGRVVVNKTGLSGSYRIAMNYDMMGGRRPRSVDPSLDAGPSVFTAVQEQLGLKLEPSKAQRDALVIDRLERPTPN